LERAKVLTEREREEVDLRARVVLGGCKERVGVLEVREKSEFFPSSVWAEEGREG
jgi:syntaxin 18